jgi:prepilin-type N-terminal cleavage/methylation domain-containing protein
MQITLGERRAFTRQRHKHRRAMTLIEVIVVVALTSILFGVAMSLLLGLRDWDRSMRRQSVQNEQLVRLGDALRTDIRQAADVSLQSDEAVVIRDYNQKQIRYELTPEGCRRIVTTPGDAQPLTDLFAVGPAMSWTLEPGAPGKRPLFAVTLHRASLDNEKRTAPLLVHAIVGADAPPTE